MLALCCVVPIPTGSNVVERSLSVREVVSSNPGRVMPESIKVFIDPFCLAFSNGDKVNILGGCLVGNTGLPSQEPRW